MPQFLLTVIYHRICRDETKKKERTQNDTLPKDEGVRKTPQGFTDKEDAGKCLPDGRGDEGDRS